MQTASPTPSPIPLSKKELQLADCLLLLGDKKRSSVSSSPTRCANIPSTDKSHSPRDRAELPEEIPPTKVLQKRSEDSKESAPKKKRRSDPSIASDSPGSPSSPREDEDSSDTKSDNYYYKHYREGETPIKGAWSKEETKLFLNQLKFKGEETWGAFSKRIPGRNGEQCNGFYRYLIRNRKIDPIPMPHSGKRKNTHSYIDSIAMETGLAPSPPSYPAHHPHHHLPHHPPPHHPPPHMPTWYIPSDPIEFAPPPHMHHPSAMEPGMPMGMWSPPTVPADKRAPMSGLMYYAPSSPPNYGGHPSMGMGQPSYADHYLRSEIPPSGAFVRSAEAMRRCSP
eukprot:TRINITY_DN13_c0_g1_i3.p1 TRINITY_DN13_c0_g1~~TRINITY_DN13_c0_g1_i3.p1  ORF type:complete len:338 (+),score=-18.49 TRINITY_DN13_c0_g1_i3:17-1030(+)